MFGQYISSEHLYMLAHILMFTFPYCLTLWDTTALYQVSFVWASYIRSLKINVVTQQILICIVVLRSHQWSLRCSSQCCYSYMTVIRCNMGLKNIVVVLMHCLLLMKLWNTSQKEDQKSTVPFLDASKAFDKVLRNGIFKKLLDRGIPVSFVKLMRYWCSNLQCRVKWNNVQGDIFPVLCGVRQGGILSPVLFALYTDGVISELILSGHGVHIGSLFIGCVLYMLTTFCCSQLPAVVCNSLLIFVMYMVQNGI